MLDLNCHLRRWLPVAVVCGCLAAQQSPGAPVSAGGASAWWDFFKDAAAPLAGVVLGGWIAMRQSKRQSEEQNREAAAERTHRRLESVVEAYQELLLARHVVVNELRSHPAGTGFPKPMFHAVNEALWKVSVRDPQNARMHLAVIIRDALKDQVECKVQGRDADFEKPKHLDEEAAAQLASALQNLIVKNLHPVPKSDDLESAWPKILERLQKVAGHNPAGAA